MLPSPAPWDFDWSQMTKSEPNKSDCMHVNCSSCKGTGVKSTGESCIHGISCPCKNCRTYS